MQRTHFKDRKNYGFIGFVGSGEIAVSKFFKEVFYFQIIFCSLFLSVWFGVITVVAVEIGLLTPPFGMSAFTVKATLPREYAISLQDIFSGTMPFTICMVLILLVLIVFPNLALLY